MASPIEGRLRLGSISTTWDGCWPPPPLAAAPSHRIRRSGVGAEGRRRAKVWRRELRSACALAVSVAGLRGGPWCSSGGRSVAAGMWSSPL